MDLRIPILKIDFKTTLIKQSEKKKKNISMDTAKYP